MNPKLILGLSFGGLAIAGGVAVFFYIKKKKREEAENDITEEIMKEAELRREMILEEEKKSEDEVVRIIDDDNSATKGDSILDYVNFLRESSKKKHRDYSELYSDGDIVDEDDILENTNDEDYFIIEPHSENLGKEVPYVIDPMEFGELYDYNKISLTYYENDILTDDQDEPIEDPYNIIGDALDHFGEYEDDAVHVRNDQYRCDYEIIKVDRDYEK